MANPPSSGDYQDYPSAEDLPAVTLDPATGLAKAPPPPPDRAVMEQPGRSQGVQNSDQYIALGGMPLEQQQKVMESWTAEQTQDFNAWRAGRAQAEAEFNQATSPSYSTDQPPPKVAAAETGSRTDLSDLNEAVEDFVDPADLGLFGPEVRYGSLPRQVNKGKVKAAADTRKGKACDGGWYDTAIKSAQNMAGFSKQSTIKGGNPLCRPGGTDTTRYSMTEWDGIPREPRVPFIITTQHRLEKGVPLWPRGSGGSNSDEAKQNQFIIFKVNPNQLHITQALRGAEAKTRVGTVYYVWQDPLKRSFFDEPTVGITFNSGNLFPWSWLNAVPFGTALPSLADKVPPGIETFYRFMALLNEGKMMPGGRPNFVYITVNTRKFPQLTLAGWFTPEGVSSVTDSADDPNHLTWTANFHCRATYPRLYNSGELLSVFKSMAKTLPLPGVLRKAPGTLEDPHNALEVARQLGPNSPIPR
jgi:hypothetical protein